jgi:Aldehyde oxidase and xanthine dehydrogenase, a/b hammerhead domain
LLTGEGMFTADRIIARALHVAFRRSDHAHALISRVDASAAAGMPGVFAVYAAHDLDDLIEPVRAPSRMQNYHATELSSLARDKVRYVGEPVVAVLAENRYLAEDAIARVEIAYDLLETVIDPEIAVRKGNSLEGRCAYATRNGAPAFRNGNWHENALRQHVRPGLLVQQRRIWWEAGGKSVARSHRTVLAYWKFESISLQPSSGESREFLYGNQKRCSNADDAVCPHANEHYARHRQHDNAYSGQAGRSFS